MLQSETVVEDERIRRRTGTGDGRENGGGGSSEKVGKGRIGRGGGRLRNKAYYFAVAKVLKEGSQEKKVREPVMQGKWSGRFAPMPCPPPLLNYC